MEKGEEEEDEENAQLEEEEEAEGSCVRSWAVPHAAQSSGPPSQAARLH